MMDSEFKCPEGREVSELLAYVEGDLDASSRGNLEEHLMVCRACSGEVASLRRMALLLSEHPESLHPGEVELYRFVSSGQDPERRIESHVAWCEECREDVRMLEEMLSLSDQAPDHRQPLPHALIRRLEKQYSLEVGSNTLKALNAFFKKLVSQPFRAPFLALGTAAAVLIIAVVSIPMWLAYKNSAMPLLPVPAEKTVRTGDFARTRTKHEELPADGLSSKPTAPVAGEIRGKRMIPGKTPHAEIPTSEETQAAVTTVPSGSRLESKRSDKSRRRRAAGAFHEKEGVMNFSAQGHAPEAPKKSLLKAKQAPAPAAREALPTPRTTAKEGATRRQVTIRIVDRDGRIIPWLHIRLPQVLAEGVRLGDAEEATHEERSRLKNGLTGAQPDSLQGRAAKGPMVLVRVGTSKHLYDVTAELFEAGSDRAVRTIEAFGISKGELERKLNAIVASLLEVPKKP